MIQNRILIPKYFGEFSNIPIFNFGIIIIISHLKINIIGILIYLLQIMNFIIYKLKNMMNLVTNIRNEVVDR